MTKFEFYASKYKASQDREGEVTLMLKVPQSDADQVLAIPVQCLLRVAIVPKPDGLDTDEG